MSFFNNLKKVLHLGGGHDAKKKRVFNNIRDNCDPADNWEMVGELGDGAFGKVYKAQHKTKGQLAAAKMCVLDNEDDLADFTVEIDILTECHHPNVVELHEAYFIDNKLWMLLEYCDGGALDSVMSELAKGLSEKQIAYVCREMCKGLQFLHSNKVIHRDLKAGNVLATMTGGVKLADFGVSAKNKSTLQKHDTFIGTPYWMAPEVVLCETFRDNPYDFKFSPNLNAHGVKLAAYANPHHYQITSSGNEMQDDNKFKVDIWSLGITLIEFAQMEPPNHEMTPMRVLLKIQKSEPPSLDEPSKWSQTFNQFISRALVKDPEKRPTAVELLQHDFVCGPLDSKPLRDLLLEYRAEVVEEELLDDDSEEHRSSQMHMEMEDDSTSVRSADTPDVKMSEPAPGATPARRATPPPAMSPRAADFPPPQPSAPVPAAAKRPHDDEPPPADRKPQASKKEKGPAPRPPSTVDTPPATPPRSSPQSQAPRKQPAPQPPVVSEPAAKGRLIVEQVCREAEKAVEEKKTDRHQDTIEKEREPVKPKAPTAPENRIPTPESKDAAPKKEEPEAPELRRQDSKENRLQKEEYKELRRQESKENRIPKDDSRPELRRQESRENRLQKEESRPELRRQESKENRLQKDDPRPEFRKQESKENRVQREVNAIEKKEEPRIEKNRVAEVRPITPPPKEESRPALAQSVVTVQSPSPTVVVEIRDGGATTPADRPEPNSLAGTHAAHVTVTTTHPPVLLNSEPLPPNAVTISTPPPIADEVVIVANNSNKTSAAATLSTTSSDDDCFAPSSLDSLDCSSSTYIAERLRGRRLDSSEVLILSPGATGDSGVFDDSVNNGVNLDTSHVSVVTVGGANEVRVRDSAATHIAVGDGLHHNHSRLSPDSFERSQSDSGSVVSSRSDSRSGRAIDIDNHVDHEQQNGGTRVNTESTVIENGEPVVLRRKTQDGPHPNRIQRSKEDIHLANLKKKTRKRTRKFEIDGVVVTTTTSKVIWGDDESGRTWDDHALRKQELREIKMLQKQEQKQFQDLAAKELQLREHQDKRFEAELASLSRAHESELDTLARAQRAAAERAEQQLEAELRAASKRLRGEHERDLRHFRDTLKQELRLLKQEVELVPKDRRKEAYRQRRARLDAEHAEREREYVQTLADAHDAVLRRIHDHHRERQALADRQYLQQRQQIMRTREAALWELEEKQIHERHQLAKRQLKDEFLLHRHQMLVRHDKELEQIKRKNTRKEEELAKCQTLEKRSLPKRIRSEMKAREMMFRESLRISATPHDDERDKLKKFQENEKRRYRAEQQRLATKHTKAREELKAAGEALLRELEQYQNEKRKALMNHETNKMKTVEERYGAELKVWRATLGDRKQNLIEEFVCQLNDHESKYGLKIPDRKVYLDVPWPKNLLHHILSAYNQRHSLIGSLSRSRTTLNLLGPTSSSRRRSISPTSYDRLTKSAASSASNTAKRSQLSKANRYSSTTNLKLASEKISGFSVFSGPDIKKREPIMAYGNEFGEHKRTIERSKPVDKRTSASPLRPKLNRQSVSEQLFKVQESPDFKRSMSQQNLKRDINMEAVVIDLPSLDEDSPRDGESSTDHAERHFSRWGPFRGSNSYSNAPSVPVSQLSTLNLTDVKKNGPNDSAV